MEWVFIRCDGLMSLVRNSMEKEREDGADVSSDVESAIEVAGNVVAPANDGTDGACFGFDANGAELCFFGKDGGDFLQA